MRLRFHSLLAVFTLVLLLASMGVTGWISLEGTRAAVADLAARHEASLAARINERLAAFLADTRQVAELNGIQPLDLHDMPRLQTIFWTQLTAFANTTAIFAGSESREFSGVERRPDGSILLTRANRQTGYSFNTYIATPEGEIDRQIRALPDYDPRKRPWYRRALEANGTVWTDIYPFPLHKTLYLSAVRSKHDAQGKLAGVVAAAISLDRIGQFLEPLAAEEGGRVYIFDRGGLLVAASTREQLYRSDDRPDRLHAFESADPLIVASARAAAKAAGDWGNLVKPIRADFEYEGERQILGLRPFSDGRGIDWLLAVTIPENSLLAASRRAQTRTIGWISAVAILAVAISLLIARRMARPLLALDRAAERVASGDLDIKVTGSGPAEVIRLAESFNRMVERLHESFEALRMANLELEVRVIERTNEINAKNRQLEEEIAERRSGEAAVRRERDFTLALINSLPGIFYVIGRDSRFVLWNRNLEILSGMNGDEVGRAAPVDFFCGTDRERIAEAVNRVFETGEAEIEADFVAKDGHGLPYYFTGRRIDLAGIPHLVGMGIDIRQRREAEEKIRHLARHDPLTGLPNRTLLKDRLEQALAAAKRAQRKLAVLFLDLDGFKEVNDVFGHTAGDAVIREAAKRIASCVREADTVARYGGDEFIILLTSVEGEAGVGRVAKEVLRAIEMPYFVEGAAACLSASIGAAIFPDHGPAGDSLIAIADQAMYRAKEAGKGRLVIAGRETASG